MNKFFLSITFCIISAFGFSQSSDIGNWMIYFGNKKINSKWNIHHEVQYRNYNMIGDLEQLLLRAGVGYNLTENNNNLLLGYGFIHSQNYFSFLTIDDAGNIIVDEDKNEVNEHRIYQQFITKQSIGRLKVQHRYRIEERFVENQNIKMRFRYFLSLNLPLNHKEMSDNTVYLSAYNEIFVVPDQSPFDRDRLYGGIGFKLNSFAKFELGYMNQIFGGSSRDQLNVIAFLSF